MDEREIPQQVWISVGDERFPEDDIWTERPDGLPHGPYVRIPAPGSYDWSQMCNAATDAYAEALAAGKFGSPAMGVALRAALRLET